MSLDSAARERLRSETTVPGLLSATARVLVELLGARACTISRVIGDLLVDLIQYDATGQNARLGHGYLISDYPLTREVIEQRAVRTVFVDDPRADTSEVKLLRELGYGSLLMVALESGEGAWGLAEVYGESDQRFGDEQVALVRELAGEVSDLLRQLERPTA